MPAIANNANIIRSGGSYSKAAPVSYTSGTRPSVAANKDLFVYNSTAGVHQVSDGTRWYDLKYFGFPSTPTALVPYTAAARPSALSNAGEIIRNTTTGQIERSNGLDWIALGTSYDEAAEAILGYLTDGLPAPARIASRTAPATVYIDPTGGAGSGTLASPLNAIPGTTVAGTAYLIKAGTTLTQNLALNVNGTAGNPIVVGVYAAGTGARVSTLAAATLQGHITVTGDYVTVDGLQVNANNGSGRISLSGADDCQILNCRSSGGNANGIYADNCQRLAIDGCETSTNDLSGIKLARSSSTTHVGIRVFNNTANNNKEAGIFWETPGGVIISDSQIASNTLWGNGITGGMSDYSRCSIALWMDIAQAAGALLIYRNDMRNSVYAHVRLQSRGNTPPEPPDGMLVQNNYMYGSSMPIHFTNVKGKVVIELNKIDSAGSNDGGVTYANPATKYGRAIELFGADAASRCENIVMRRNAIYRSFSFDEYMTEGMALGFDDNTAFCTAWGNWCRDTEGSAVQFNTNVGNVCNANVFINSCIRPDDSAAHGPVGVNPTYGKRSDIGGSGSDCLIAGNIVISGRILNQQQGSLSDEGGASGFEWSHNLAVNGRTGGRFNTGSGSIGQYNRYRGCTVNRRAWDSDFSEGASVGLGTGETSEASGAGTTASAHLNEVGYTALMSLPYAGIVSGGGGGGGEGGGGGGGVDTPTVGVLHGGSQDTGGTGPVTVSLSLPVSVAVGDSIHLAGLVWSTEVVANKVVGLPVMAGESFVQSVKTDPLGEMEVYLWRVNSVANAGTGKSVSITLARELATVYSFYLFAGPPLDPTNPLDTTGKASQSGLSYTVSASPAASQATFAVAAITHNDFLADRAVTITPDVAWTERGARISSDPGPTNLAYSRSIGAAGPVTFAGSASVAPTSWWHGAVAAYRLAGGTTPPSITTGSTLPAAAVGTAYSAALAATGTGPIAWSVVSGSLPPGLALGPTTGIISGTPTAGGTYTPTIRASNSSPTPSDRAFTLSVSTGAVSPTITTVSPLPNGAIGVPYSATLAASGTAPFSWAVTAGSLPAGLVLGPVTGAITGTPTTAGAASFTVTATGTGTPGSKAFSLTIDGAATAPTITTGVTLPAGTIGAAYGVTLQATGTLPITWSLAPGSTPLPVGLQLNPLTGLLGGIPASSGTFTPTIRATGVGAPNDRQFSITVAQPASQLTVIPATIALSVATGPVTIQVLDASLNPLPAAAAQSARVEISKPGFVAAAAYFASGKLTLTPVGVGTGSITIVFGDQTDAEQTVTRPFTVTP